MIFRQSILIGILWSAIGVFYQCQSGSPVEKEDALERNLTRAGNNRVELEKVLQHYQQDSLKLKAATLLISNMERNYYYYNSDWLGQYNAIFNHIAPLSEQEIITLKDSIITSIGSPEQAKNARLHDLRTVSADYLIANIEEAFTAWQAAPWRDSVSFDLFCNYILPYKNFSESPEQWRTMLRSRYQNILDNPAYNATPAELGCQINNDLKSWFRYSDQFNDYPGRISIDHLMKGHHGNCSDMANLGAHAFRALGIPTAIDYTPQWGNYHDGHVWNALIINEKKSSSFLGAEVNPDEYSALSESESKIAKAFRQTLFIQNNSVASKAAQMAIKDVPIYLQNPRVLDVTTLYTQAYDVTLQIKAPKQSFIYLCIAKREKWEAIAGSEIDAQGNATFIGMGHNVLYNPMFYKNGKYLPAGVPFILTYEGKLHVLNADHTNTQSLRLTRVFPFKRADAKWKYAEYYRDSKLQGAHTPDFKNAVTLYTITHPLDKWHIGQVGGPSLRDRLDHESMWKETTINNNKAYRYIRLIFPENQFFKVGELALLDAAGSPLAGKPIGSVQHPEWAFDGVPGYSIIDESPQGGHWVGLDLGEPKQISQLRYLPATGEHAIQPDKTYELFYWNKEWISLGVKKATKHVIEFEKMPTNALFWLHCQDCEKTFERPFTYENNRQVWW